MVGDYPEIDIKGGKQNGMSTVLVESGLYNKENSSSHSEFLRYADFIVPNIKDAVELILRNK